MKISFSEAELIALLDLYGLAVHKAKNTRANTGKQPTMVLAEALNTLMLARVDERWLPPKEEPDGRK